MASVPTVTSRHLYDLTERIVNSYFKPLTNEASLFDRLLSIFCIYTFPCITVIQQLFLWLLGLGDKLGEGLASKLQCLDICGSTLSTDTHFLSSMNIPPKIWTDNLRWRSTQKLKVGQLTWRNRHLEEMKKRYSPAQVDQPLQKPHSQNCSCFNS